MAKIVTSSHLFIFYQAILIVLPPLANSSSFSLNKAETAVSNVLISSSSPPLFGTPNPSNENISNRTRITIKSRISNKTAVLTRSATRKTPFNSTSSLPSTSQSNGTRIHHHYAGNSGSNGGIGYGGEYAEEWPIYVAILGLTVFAYVAWVLVYCLCQRNGNGANNYHSSLGSTSTGTVELTAQHSFNSLLSNNNNNRGLMPPGHLATIANGSYYRQSSMSIQASIPGIGSPECSLEGASLHDMIPPKYLQALSTNVSFNESANNTLMNCNDDFTDDGNNETYIVVPRHVPPGNGSHVSGSPPGYSDLTRISVVINPCPSVVSDDDEATGISDHNTTERSPLVPAAGNNNNQHQQEPIPRSASGHLTSTNNNGGRQFLQSSPSAGNWIRRNVARLHSNGSGTGSHQSIQVTKQAPSD